MTPNRQRSFALIAGGVFTVLGLAGFLGGLEALDMSANTLQNLVYLVSGLLGLWAAGSTATGGRVGLLAKGFTASTFATQSTNHRLHPVVGVVLATVGFAAASKVEAGNRGMGRLEVLPFGPGQNMPGDFVRVATHVNKSGRAQDLTLRRLAFCVSLLESGRQRFRTGLMPDGAN
ncbi:MAG: hypothetical protein C4333_12835 [Meiothermus sp.]|mgnify:CR=1 FL=1